MLGQIAIEQTRNGVLLADNFNDGIMDTSSSLLDLAPWQPLYADSNLAFQETLGYFRVYGNTGPTSAGQHRGIQTNPYTYANWSPSSLESLEVVSVVEMWNLDPITPATDGAGGPEIARMTNHLCSNCYTSTGDFNATVTLGYLLGTGTGPGWDPPGGKWGFRVKWADWASRYLTATDSLFGDEQDGFYLTMVDNWGFDELDSTLATGYVYHDGNWTVLGSRKLDLEQCRKTELKSMCRWARNHDIDYRWDNYRLFLNSKRWPVHFQLVNYDSLPLLGDYVLDVYRTDNGQFVDRDTLSAMSEFSIFLDHTELAIPQSLNLVLYKDFVDSAATSSLPASEVTGCYPDDAYVLYYDTAGASTTVGEASGTEPRGVWLGQNVPNPWNPMTRIPYVLPERYGGTQVRLDVYDLSGRFVRALVDEWQEAGEHVVFWDGTSQNGLPVASGIYLYRIHADGNTLIRRMVLVR